jgi:hypothetical protein
MDLVALALQLGTMIYGHTYRIPPDDDDVYFGAEAGRIARSMALGRGFSLPYPQPTGPSAYLPPAYPALIAAVLKWVP